MKALSPTNELDPTRGVEINVEKTIQCDGDEASAGVESMREA